MALRPGTPTPGLKFYFELLDRDSSQQVEHGLETLFHDYIDRPLRLFGYERNPSITTDSCWAVWWPAILFQGNSDLLRAHYPASLERHYPQTFDNCQYVHFLSVLLWHGRWPEEIIPNRKFCALLGISLATCYSCMLAVSIVRFMAFRLLV